MPQMGISVAEGTVSRWLKAVGDLVSVDEPLLEISTDKVDTEVPSPVAGRLARILAEEGETVAVGGVLAQVSTDTENAQPQAEVAPAAAPSAPEPAAAGSPLVSPLVARLLAEHSLAIGTIRGTGRNGRVTKKDVLAAVQAPAPAAPAPAVQAPAAAPAAPAPAQPEVEAAAPAVADAEAGESFEPMSPMRRAIAEHMRRSLDTAPHASSIVEVDMSNVRSARARLKREYEERHGVNLTYLAFVAHATVATLGEYPWINGELRGDQIVTKNAVNLGIAVEVQEGKGLLVPVIRNAESLSLLGMASAIADIARRARDRKLVPDDLHGGTITITNPGGFGIVGGNPIINQPQSAILGCFAVVDRPWAVKDERGQPTLGIRPIMNLSLTYDHRLVDGAYAGRYLRDLRARLESWPA
jgi:2-oxoglutarate dehydrogenase E2 component (dihydrolipoamide succinyltransferase)